MMHLGRTKKNPRANEKSDDEKVARPTEPKIIPLFSPKDALWILPCLVMIFIPRTLAAPLVPPLHRVGFVPNDVTWMKNVVQVVALSFLWNRDVALFSLLTTTSWVLDDVDGMMARRYNQIGAFGDLLDHIGDVVCVSIIILIAFWRLNILEFFKQYKCPLAVVIVVNMIWSTSEWTCSGRSVVAKFECPAPLKAVSPWGSYVGQLTLFVIICILGRSARHNQPAPPSYQRINNKVEESELQHLHEKEKATSRESLRDLELGSGSGTFQRCGISSSASSLLSA